MTRHADRDVAGVQDPAFDLVACARDLACRLLEDNPERWAHTVGVAARAVSLRGTVSEGEADLLVAAAWLHDIGYAAQVRDTGFHPLDGARYLRARGWDPTVCDLVAHHSGSRFVARVCGLAQELSEFAYDEGPVTDALTVADQTTGLSGSPVSLDVRVRNTLERHRADSAATRAFPEREPYFRAALERVSRRLPGADEPSLVDGA